MRRTKNGQFAGHPNGNVKGMRSYFAFNEERTQHSRKGGR